MAWLVWILNGWKENGCKWSGFWMGFEIRKPNHLKSRQMVAIFVNNHLKSWQKCPDFEWSSFQIVGTIALAISKPNHLKDGPFEIRHSISPDLKCFWVSKGQISDPYCIFNHMKMSFTIELPQMQKSKSMFNKSTLLVNVFRPFIDPRRQKTCRRNLLVDQKFWWKTFRNFFNVVL